MKKKPKKKVSKKITIKNAVPHTPQGKRPKCLCLCYKCIACWGKPCKFNVSKKQLLKARYKAKYLEAKRELERFLIDIYEEGTRIIKPCNFEQNAIAGYLYRRNGFIKARLKGLENLLEAEQKYKEFKEKV